jgi:hypothetical protein
MNVIIERGRVWLERGNQRWMLAYDDDELHAVEWYAQTLRAALAAQPSAEPSEWGDHVEQRIRSWRNSRINSDGDRLALDDYLSDSDIDDLVDHVCGDAASSQSHQLYQTGDPDAPDAVRDRNGDVVLSMCKVCGKAEVELSEPCVAQPRAEDDAQDARRYRLLRRGQHWSVVNGIGDTLRADALDAAIDAAMGNAPEAKGEPK